MKNRSSMETIKVYKEIYRYLELRGMKPCLHKLDNEVSETLKEFIVGEAWCKLQLAPPHIHRHNSAEREIITFKDHFIAGLASTDPDFPTSLWCWLLPHAKTILNLMRASRINPKLAVYEKFEDWHQRTQTSQLLCGVDYYHMPKQYWTSWGNLESNRNWRCMHNSRDSFMLMQHR